MNVDNSCNSKGRRTDVIYLRIKFLSKVLYTLGRKYDVHDMKGQLWSADGSPIECRKVASRCCGIARNGKVTEPLRDGTVYSSDTGA